MFTKEILERAMDEVKKEKEWLILESYDIKKLSHAVEKGDYGEIKEFIQKSARAERRINAFEERVIQILNYLKYRVPSWDQALSQIEEQTRIYNRNIMKRISFNGGTIPNLIRKNNFNELSNEVDKVMKEGVTPLSALLNHLWDQLEKHYVTEKEKEKLLPPEIEAKLDRRPFLIVFHSANEVATVTEVLANSHSLPDHYMNRWLEYAFEVDYFWYEYNGKVHGFLGHTPHYLTRRTIIKNIKFWEKTTTKPNRKLLEMRRGTYSGITKNLAASLYRKGLLLPEWLLSKIGIIKLMVEIKSGIGDDIKALDELIMLVKSYHLENSIIFLSFNSWTLEYLKQRLPNAFTVHMLLKKIPFISYQYNSPFNKFFKSIRSNPYSPLINSFSAAAKESENKNLERIKHAIKNNKLYIDWKVKSKQHLDILVKHGARGAIIWKEPKEILEWLAHPELAENKESIASKPF